MRTEVKRALAATAAAVVCLGVGAVVLRPSSDAGQGKAAASAPPRAAVASVKTETVSNRLTVAGEFLPYQEVELHAKVAGYIRKINVDIGDRVKAGQVLAVLEVPELNAQVLGADAGVRHSRDEIARAQHEVARAEASHNAVHAAALRLEQASAARPGLIAQQELDDAQAKDRESEARVESAKASLSAAQQQLDVSRATHSQVSAMQDYSRIVAPFAGVITWRYADNGALLQAGTSNVNSMPLVKLAQIRTLRLRLPVPESIAPRVHVGTTADIRVQATGERFNGTVARITDSLDRATRTMQVEIDVPNVDNKLSPGMYADVTLEVDKRDDALTVPVQAVNVNGERATVLVLDGQSRVQVRQIRTGMEDAQRIEVLEGLQAGDKVVVGNLRAYRAGDKVTPQPSKMASAAERGGVD